VQLYIALVGKTVGDHLTLFLTLSLTLNFTLTLTLTLLLTLSLTLNLTLTLFLTLNLSINVTVIGLGGIPRFCRASLWSLIPSASSSHVGGNGEPVPCGRKVTFTALFVKLRPPDTRTSS